MNVERVLFWSPRVLGILFAAEMDLSQPERPLGQPFPPREDSRRKDHGLPWSLPGLHHDEVVVTDLALRRAARTRGDQLWDIIEEAGILRRPR